MQLRRYLELLVSVDDMSAVGKGMQGLDDAVRSLWCNDTILRG